MNLYSDCVQVLTEWAPADGHSEKARLASLELLAGGPEVLTREHRPGHVTASALVLSHDGSRVLLNLHGRIRRWMQFGGHLEPADATLRAAALREATEESGIAGLILSGEPIHADIHEVASCAGSATLHYDVRYLAYAPQGAVEEISEESAELGWFAPDDLPEPLAHSTESLVRAALATRQTR